MKPLNRNRFIEEFLPIMLEEEPLTLKAELSFEKEQQPDTRKEPRIIIVLYRGRRPSWLQTSSEEDKPGVDEIAKAIIKEGYINGRRVVAEVFDPGTANSDPNRGPAAVVEFLKREAPDMNDKVVYIGHSHGGHRAYIDVQNPPSGIAVDLLITVDPIDTNECPDILPVIISFSLGKCDQAGMVKPAPGGVPYVNYVQRQKGEFLKGYSIGVMAAECPGNSFYPGVPPFNSSCIVEGWKHTEIPIQPGLHKSIIAQLKNL